MSRRLEIEFTSPRPRSVQIVVAGEIDIGTGGQLRAAIEATLDRRPNELILDLTDVKFADSQLVHVLEEVGDASKPEASRSVRVVGARRQIARMLALCGLAHLCDEVA